MKHVKRILATLMSGILFGVSMGIFLRFCQNSETWFRDAYFAGCYYAIGFFVGTGIKFFHKDK